MERVPTKQVRNHFPFETLTKHEQFFFFVQVKNRTKRLSELFKSYQPYDDQVGQRQPVLVTDISHDKNYYVGHNKDYVQVTSSVSIALIRRYEFPLCIGQGAGADETRIYGQNGGCSHRFS